MLELLRVMALVTFLLNVVLAVIDGDWFGGALGWTCASLMAFNLIIERKM